jgi:hypothetical protein
MLPKSTTHGIRPAEWLCGRREDPTEGVADVVTPHDDEAGLVSAGHHAQATGLQVELPRVLHAGERMNHDHQFPLESLPAFGSVDFDESS